MIKAINGENGAYRFTNYVIIYTTINSIYIYIYIYIYMYIYIYIYIYFCYTLYLYSNILIIMNVWNVIE